MRIVTGIVERRAAVLLFELCYYLCRVALFRLQVLFSRFVLLGTLRRYLITSDNPNQVGQGVYHWQLWRVQWRVEKSSQAVL